jgi:hypothetical protein
VMMDYLIFQAIFLLGAIYFKRYALLKTVLCLVCVGITFTLLAHIVFSALFGVHSAVYLAAYSRHLNEFKSAFWLVLAPLCWVISYVRLKEAEI